MKVYELPVALFYLIREYFIIKHASTTYFDYVKNCKNWRSFLKCSKSKTLRELKKLMIYYNLDPQFSLEFLRDPSFRARVESVITSMKLQIGLRIRREFNYVSFPVFPPVHFISASNLNINDIAKVRAITRLEFIECQLDGKFCELKACTYLSAASSVLFDSVGSLISPITLIFRN
jgi:hypothetical protein